MINTLRADFYRLKYTKGFWIAQIVLTAVIIISIVSQATSSVAVEFKDINTLPPAESNLIWTGIVALQEMSSMGSFLIYILLPLLVIILGHDFSKLTYKNALTVGVSRQSYFFAKYLTLICATLLQLTYYYLMSFAVGTFLHGIGEGINQTIISNICQNFLSQFILLSAIISLAIFALYLTGSSVIAILTGILTPLFIAILHLQIPDNALLRYTNLQDNIDELSQSGLGSSDLLLSLLAAGIIITITLTTSLLVFKKREL